MTNIPPIPPAPRHVLILAFPAVQLLDVAGPLQVFVTANDLASAAGLPAPYRVQVVAPTPTEVTSSCGLGLLTEPLPSPAMAVDSLVVAGGAGTAQVCRDRLVLDWIVGVSSGARRTASVCTGAFILATAGLLNGRRATTHWARCADLARSFPLISVEPDAIHVNDGAVWTSAGVTAGIDLALALVEADVGRALAGAVARHLVVFARRPGGQAQFSTSLALAGCDPQFDALHDWMRHNLHGPLSVPRLAEQAGMTERSFLRRYRQVTGMTPARAVERLRLEAARQALGRTGTSMKQIARACGFGSEETMRRSFQRVLAVSPRSYQDRFPT